MYIYCIFIQQLHSTSEWKISKQNKKNTMAFVLVFVCEYVVSGNYCLYVSMWSQELVLVCEYVVSGNVVQQSEGLGRFGVHAWK